MGRESEPRRYRGRKKYLRRVRGRGGGYFKKRSYSSSYKLEEVKFVTISRNKYTTKRSLRA